MSSAERFRGREGSSRALRPVMTRADSSLLHCSLEILSKVNMRLHFKSAYRCRQVNPTGAARHLSPPVLIPQYRPYRALPRPVPDDAVMPDGSPLQSSAGVSDPHPVGEVREQSGGGGGWPGGKIRPPRGRRSGRKSPAPWRGWQRTPSVSAPAPLLLRRLPLVSASTLAVV